MNKNLNKKKIKHEKMKKDLCSLSGVVLIIITLIATFLRIWNLPAADVITDEGLNSFRSIGYIDFFVSELQTTPYDWYGSGQDLPKWVSISFHDHPPFTFFVQHVFFKIAGVNDWSMRLPFALAGIFSVYLLYLIGKELFKDSIYSEAIGLTSAFLLAINDYHVWISRIGLQESFVILFILASVYYFLKAIEVNKYFIHVGVFLGLGLLSKYTTIILLPTFVIFLLIYKKEIFKAKQLWIGAGISVFLFLPVVFYNFKLFTERGHFDFQFSYLLGQSVPEWQFRLGRLQAGSFIERLRDVLPAFWRWVTPVFAVFGSLTFLVAIYHWLKQKKRALGFLVIILSVHLLLFLAIGPTERFVVMLIPWFCLLLGYYLLHLLGPVFKTSTRQLIFISIVSLACLILIGYEIVFAYNTTMQPNKLTGREGLNYSVLKHESLNWGYGELDEYLKQNLYHGQYPAFQFPTRFNFLEDIKTKALENAKSEGKKAKNVLLIYDSNMHSSATIWYILRPFVYEAWPYISADTYLQVLENEGQDFFRNQGIGEFIFIKATENTLLRSETDRTDGSEKLEQVLKDSNVYFDSITNERVGEAFRIYYYK